MTAHELQLSGLPGPTHTYRGLAKGNVASAASRGRRSNPRAAARQSLALIEAMTARGIPVAIMPPQLRPAPQSFAALGMAVRDAHQAARTFAALLKDHERTASALLSSSFMWTANAATVAGSAETPDGRVQLSPANLNAHLHRALEAGETARRLALIFGDASRFRVHTPLPASDMLADEGAADHMRLWPTGAVRGLHVFVHGRAAADTEGLFARVRPRQTLEASQLVAARHGLDPASVVHLRQHPAALDAGSFHNDVIATSDHALFFAHETAFAEGDATARIARAFEAMHGRPLTAVTAAARDLSLEKAVATYLFNGQLIVREGRRVFFAPLACRDDPDAAAVIDALLVAPGHVQEVVHADLSESLANGGGPACLRLRVWLTGDELAALDRRFVATPALIARLRAAVDAAYPDDLAIEDFTDARTIVSAARAHAALAAAFGAPELYPDLGALTG